jgi:hypothetical protein
MRKRKLLMVDKTNVQDAINVSYGATEIASVSMSFTLLSMKSPIRFPGFMRETICPAMPALRELPCIEACPNGTMSRPGDGIGPRTSPPASPVDV